MDKSIPGELENNIGGFAELRLKSLWFLLHRHLQSKLILSRIKQLPSKQHLAYLLDPRVGLDTRDLLVLLEFVLSISRFVACENLRVQTSSQVESGFLRCK